MMPTIKLKLTRPNAQKPMYQTLGSAGADLIAALAEPVTLQPMQRTLIPTGLVMEIPEGYEVQIRPRSGLSIKHGITLINCVGTIDSDYRNEVMVPLVNLSTDAYTVEPGDRIAQMVVAPVTLATFAEVELVAASAERVGGFGSTGR